MVVCLGGMENVGHKCDGASRFIQNSFLNFGERFGTPCALREWSLSCFVVATSGEY